MRCVRYGNVISGRGECTRAKGSVTACGDLERVKQRLQQRSARNSNRISLARNIDAPRRATNQAAIIPTLCVDSQVSKLKPATARGGRIANAGTSARFEDVKREIGRKISDDATDDCCGWHIIEITGSRNTGGVNGRGPERGG